MRYLITILLIWQTAQGQMTINWAGSSRTQTPGTSETITITFSGEAQILIVVNRHSTSPNRPTVTSASSVWQDLGSITTGIGTQIVRMTAFVCYPVQKGASESTTIDFGGQTGSFYSRQMWYATGRNTRVVQAISEVQSTTNPTVTMGALSGVNNNAVVASYIGYDPSFTAAWGTPEAGWTENEDYGRFDGMGGYNMSRANHSDNTPTVNAASTKWVGFAIELKANRRIYIQ